MTDTTFSDHSSVFHGPNSHIDLAPLDSRHLEHYSCRLLIFCCLDSTQRNAQLLVLKSGLQALVTQCPLLGGKIVPLSSNDHSLRNDDHDCYTIVPGDGLELVVKDLQGKISSLKKLEAANFSSSMLPDELLMPITDEDKSTPACKAQYSAIEGGTILSFTISHHLADGSGTNELMRMLSEATRLASQNASLKSEAVVGLDRILLRNITSETPFKIEDHLAYTPKLSTSQENPPREQEIRHPFEATDRETSILIRIPPAGLAKLKSDAAQSGRLPISTHDALSALIWRTVMLTRSRRSSSNSFSTSIMKSKIFMPSDARRHLGLPSSYIGNAVYQLSAEIELESLLSPKGLQVAASSLRAAITSVTPERVASYMAELKERWIEWRFMTGTSTIAIAMGTDWTSTSMYTDCWGDNFGEVIGYRYPGGEGGFNCIYPKLKDGSAEIMVAVMPEEVDFLKGEEGFGRYSEM